MKDKSFPKCNFAKAISVGKEWVFHKLKKNQLIDDGYWILLEISNKSSLLHII